MGRFDDFTRLALDFAARYVPTTGQSERLLPVRERPRSGSLRLREEAFHVPGKPDNTRLRYLRGARNVCDAVDPPRVAHTQATIWTAEEVRTFLSIAVDDTYHPYWLLAVATGMRRGELLGLRWQDVDIARSRVHVRQSVTVGKKGAPIFQEPKTPKARQVIPIPGEVATVLHAHRVRQNAMRLACPAWRDHDLVFTVADGGPINPGNLLRNMRAIIAKINKEAKKDDERLPMLTIHALRHTHATLLLQQGQNAKVIEERLGHANISMTLSTYALVLPDMQEHAAEAIGTIMREPLTKEIARCFRAGFLCIQGEKWSPESDLNR